MGVVCQSHTHSKLFWLKKLIRDQSGKKFVCSLQVPGKELLTPYVCGLAIATPTGSCFGYKMLIERLTRLKFGMRFPSNRVSIINHVCANGCGLVIATPTEFIMPTKNSFMDQSG